MTLCTLMHPFATSMWPSNQHFWVQRSDPLSGRLDARDLATAAHVTGLGIASGVLCHFGRRVLRQEEWAWRLRLQSSMWVRTKSCSCGGLGGSWHIDHCETPAWTPWPVQVTLKKPSGAANGAQNRRFGNHSLGGLTFGIQMREPRPQENREQP